MSRTWIKGGVVVRPLAKRPRRPGACILCIAVDWSTDRKAPKPQEHNRAAAAARLPVAAAVEGLRTSDAPRALYCLCCGCVDHRMGSVRCRSLSSVTLHMMHGQRAPRLKAALAVCRSSTRRSHQAASLNLQARSRSSPGVSVMNEIDRIIVFRAMAISYETTCTSVRGRVEATFHSITAPRPHPGSGYRQHGTWRGRRSSRRGALIDQSDEPSSKRRRRCWGRRLPV